ncbi:MAG: MFS transporter [Hyphomonadaceae bacterium]
MSPCSAACAIWSAATMACGLARNYPQLVIARMTVGFGEAGGVPPSYAIISDYFPPGRRGTALSIFNLGPPIGAALGIAFGASIAAAFSWRDAFLVIGGIGVITAIAVILLVKEPKRGAMDASAAALPADQSGFWPTMKMFFSRPSLFLVSLGGGSTQFVTYGLGNFTTSSWMREKGMTFGGSGALYYASWWRSAWRRHPRPSGCGIDTFTRRAKQAYAIIPAISLTLAIPFSYRLVWSLRLADITAAADRAELSTTSISPLRSRWCNRRCGLISASCPGHCCCW